MQIAKWGNSLAVRLPKAVVDELQLKEGEDVEIVVGENGRVELITAQARRAEALQKIRSLKIKLPPDYKFDREEANSRSKDEE